jgi:hypothetical protein
MGKYLGNFKENAEIQLPWDTVAADGSSVAAVGGEIRIYKGDSIAQKNTGNGITDARDFDSLVGVNLLTIDTNVDTGDAGFWTSGSRYDVVLAGATIDGKAVNAHLGYFGIEYEDNKAVVTTNNDKSGYSISGAKNTLDDLNDISVADIDAGSTVLADILQDTGTSLPGLITALNDISVSDIDLNSTKLAEIVQDTGTDIPLLISALNDISVTDIDNSSTKLAAIEQDTNVSIPALLNALNDISVADILNTVLSESYPAAGQAPTLNQALFATLQSVADYYVAGLKLYVRTLAGANAMEFDLDDATNPTSRRRA